MPDNDFTQPGSITLEVLTDRKVICIPFSAEVYLPEKYLSLTELYQRLLLCTRVRGIMTAITLNLIDMRKKSAKISWILLSVTSEQAGASLKKDD